MHCDSANRECTYDGTTPIYSWLLTSVQTGVSCIVRKRPIVALDAQTKLLGTNCVAANQECEMENSIIVWESNVITYCLYRKVITLNNFTLEPGIILYHKERQLALKLAIQKAKNVDDIRRSEFKSKKECQDYLKAPLEIHETVEGLFVSGFTIAKNFKDSEVDISTIHELMLSEEDGRWYTELVGHNAARIRVCHNRLLHEID